MHIAVIPARGGSKRLPRKNIKTFCGKPMIAWSIEAAKNSGIFDKIIVSTDDIEIARVAEEWGGEIPFLRPKELAEDSTPTIPVVSHAIEWAIKNNLNVDSVCCIYPTAPLINIDDIAAGLIKLKNENWNYVFSAVAYDSTIFRAFKKNKIDSVELIFPEYIEIRSQDLPLAYYDAGLFYWGSASSWSNKLKIFSEKSSVIEIPRLRAQDINSQDDFFLAELLFKALNKSV